MAQPGVTSPNSPGEVRGTVFNIQRSCTHDGPGIRTTVFIKGCPLRCAWCHNPEGLSRERQVAFDASKCIGCRACLEACEHGGHEFDAEGTHVYKPDRCVRCGACAEGCYSEALEMMGEARAAADVMGTVLLDKPFYDASGGGITLSGGEPLAQPDFAEALLLLAAEAAISTVVQSTCATRWSTVARLVPLVDLWMCDVKHMDPVRHRELTGVENAEALANLRRLCASEARVLLRLPLVPGLNDDEDGLRALAAFVREEGPDDGLEIVPYHRFGGDKYARLGKDYAPTGTPDATDEDILRAVDLLRSAGATRISCQKIPELAAHTR